MNFGLEENKIPSFLNESLKDRNPVNVDYTPTWEKEDKEYYKIYKFKSRKILKNFISYVLDYESNTGILFETVISRDNSVKLSIEGFQVGNKLRKTLSKIDAIAKDTVESFKKYD